MGSLALKFGPYVIIAVLFWAWLEAREDLAMQIQTSNVEKLESINEAERMTREVLEAAQKDRIERLQTMAIRETQARAIAEGTLLDAIKGSEALDEQIKQLTLEASIDDIPDSKESLNVFVLESSIASLRTREDCGKASNRGNTWTNGVCTSPEDIDPANPTFSNITYSDSLILWGRDRDIIQTLNGKLAAIESLQ